MSIWRIAWFEWQRMVRIRFNWLALIVMPLLLIFILGQALSSFFTTGDLEVQPVSLAVVMLDQGERAEEVKAFLSGKAIQPYISSSYEQSRQEAVRKIKNRTYDFALVVPATFSEDLKQGRAVHCEYVLGQDRIRNRMAQAVLDNYMNHLNVIESAEAVVGVQSVMEHQVSSAMPAPHAALVETGKLTQSGKNYTATQYYAVSMLAMFMLNSGMLAGVNLAKDREGRTLLRLHAAPVARYQVLLGKLIGLGGFMMLQALLIIFSSAWLYGVDWGSAWWIVAIACLLMILGSMSLSVLVALWVKSVKLTTVLFGAILMVMTFISGGFTPSVGELLYRLSAVTLNRWAMDTCLHVMLHDPASSYLMSLLYLGLLVVGFFVITFLLYRRAEYHA